MAQQIKLRHKGNTLDLSAAPYSIGLDFVPLSSSSDDVIASGSSANTYGGGVLAARKYTDRAWSFSIRVSGTSRNDITAAIRKLASMLQLAGTSDTPLYLDYRNDTTVPEPLWGQFGAAVTYEIVSGRVGDVWSEYGIDMLRDETVFVTVEVTVKPFQQGNKQIVAIATGGIFDNTFGRVDGISSGVTIQEATTNLFTNPVFGNATYGNGWTAGSLLTVSQNTDSDYLLPMTSNSVHLTSSGTAANTYTQAIVYAAGSAIAMSAIVKLTDGGSVSSTQVSLYYADATINNVYRLLGNGFYLISGTIPAGLASGGTFASGVTVNNGYDVYLAFMQAEYKTYSTSPCWGDMLGCAWTGTVHASTSTRTAASCKLTTSDRVINASQGSIRIVARFDVANTHANFMQLFDSRSASATGSLTAYFNPTDDKIYLFTTANSTSSVAQSFSAGTIFVFHFTWGVDGLAIFINSVADGATGTYAPPTIGASLFIGSNYVSSNQLVGDVLGFATFDRALTAAQVLADYTSIAPIVARGDRVEAVPWFWTDDGDGILSLDTGKTPMGVAGGIEGNVPAITELYAALTQPLLNVYSIALSNHANDVYVPFRKFFSDQSGTATAGDYGGEHENTTLSAGTVQTAVTSTIIDLSNDVVRYFGAVEIVSYARVKSTVASTGYTYTLESTGSSAYSDPNPVTFGTLYRGFLTKPMNVSIASDLEISRLHRARFFFAMSVGTAGTASIDYFALLPRPVAVLEYTGIIPDAVRIGLRERDAFLINTDLQRADNISLRGDAIEFKPDQVNHLQMYFCPSGTVNPLTTYAGTITSIYITPRWSVL